MREMTLPFQYVDPTRFGTQMLFRGRDWAPTVRSLVTAGTLLGGANGLVREHTALGCLVSHPAESKEALRLVAERDPYQLVWYGFGYGDKTQIPRYQANAFRKMWAAALEGRDSLSLARDPAFDFPYPVPSADDDGRYPMGSFPHGGACFVTMGGMVFLCGVSALDAVEDDADAAAAGKWTGAVLLRQSNDPLTELRAAR